MSQVGMSTRLEFLATRVRPLLLPAMRMAQQVLLLVAPWLRRALRVRAPSESLWLRWVFERTWQSR